MAGGRGAVEPQADGGAHILHPAGFGQRLRPAAAARVAFEAQHQ
jgi:hypothetical protein